MIPGSLVICCNDKNFKIFPEDPPLTFPVKDQVYVIREIRCQYGEVGVLLEEITNPVHPVSGREYGFLIHRFREVQSPMSLAGLFSKREVEVI